MPCFCAVDLKWNLALPLPMSPVEQRMVGGSMNLEGLRQSELGKTIPREWRIVSREQRFMGWAKNPKFHDKARQESKWAAHNKRGWKEEGDDRIGAHTAIHLVYNTRTLIGLELKIFYSTIWNFIKLLEGWKRLRRLHIQDICQLFACLISPRPAHRVCFCKFLFWSRNTLLCQMERGVAVAIWLHAAIRKLGAAAPLYLFQRHSCLWLRVSAISLAASKMCSGPPLGAD